MHPILSIGIFLFLWLSNLEFLLLLLFWYTIWQLQQIFVIIGRALGDIRRGGKDINSTTTNNLFFLLSSLLHSGMKRLPMHHLCNLLRWLMSPLVIFTRDIKEVHPRGYEIAFLTFLWRLGMMDSKAKIDHLWRAGPFFRVYQVEQKLSFMLNPMTSTFRHNLLTGTASFQLLDFLLTVFILIIVKNVIRLDPLHWGNFTFVQVLVLLVLDTAE